MSNYHTGDEIGREIADRLALRTIAEGAETDLGARVYRGRTAIDDDLVPCCVVIEGNDEVTEGPGRGLDVKVRQRYVALAYVPCDPDHPNDAAHAALRDMKKALFLTSGKPDRTLGGAVSRVDYIGRDIGPRADGAAYVAVSLEVAVSYVEMLAAP